MKKLLIIQTDEPYFLFETIQVLEKNISNLKDYALTILVNESSYRTVFDKHNPVIKGMTSDKEGVLKASFDVSVNLSLNNDSWQLHGDVKSPHKLGVYLKNGETIVNDLWSSYLLTLKAKAPFLTFHLQDIYRNILGFKSAKIEEARHTSVRQIAFGAVNPKVFSPTEQESLIHELSLSYPAFPLKDISEVDLFSDVTHTLYIGPATLEALKFCEAGGKGIFLSSAFQGFNYLPYGNENVFLSSRGKAFEASKLLPFIENFVNGKVSPVEYATYVVDSENIFGSYLKSVNESDDNYPFYQSHVVLWNYLLNLFDTNLEITSCTPSQLTLLKTNHEVLGKLLRLHDYAMASLDTIYNESKAQTANAEVIGGHLKNLQEMDKISDQIAASHAYLRPILDFYRIRKGQTSGNNLQEQSQASYLTYAEEHQALTALNELFSVTLKKNEVNL